MNLIYYMYMYVVLSKPNSPQSPTDDTDSTEPMYDISDPTLKPREVLYALRRYQDPKHIKYQLSDPGPLRSLAILVQLGRAKYYFGIRRVQLMIESNGPGTYNLIMDAINRALDKYQVGS